MFNDDWMREKGFFDKSGLTARDLVASGVSGELLAIEGTEPVEVAVKLMGEHDFSQISITRDKRLVGSLNEAHLYDQLVRDRRRSRSSRSRRSCSRRFPSSTSRRRSSSCRR